LLIGNVLIILLDKPIKKIYNQNVFALDIKTKSIIWQVNEKKEFPGGNRDCPFSDVFINENGELIYLIGVIFL